MPATMITIRRESFVITRVTNRANDPRERAGRAAMVDALDSSPLDHSAPRFLWDSARLVA